MADVIGLVISCGEIIKTLRDVCETMKDAPRALLDILDRTSALNLLLKRLQAHETQLNLDQQSFLRSSFDKDKCWDTIRDLKKLVHESRIEAKGLHLDLKGRFKWLLKQNNAEDLLTRLKDQEAQIGLAINLISSETIQEIFAIVSRNQPTKAFEELPIHVTPDPEDKTSPSEPQSQETKFHTPKNLQCKESQEVVVHKLNVRHLWLGQLHSVIEKRLNKEYTNDRSKLADLAFYGNWDAFFHNIQSYSKKYQQLWINATRMTDKPSHDPSGFTALHQAAYHGTSVKIVRKLILQGAWRLARAIRAPYEGMTPLDVARSSGFEHLYEILSPVIKHTVPPKTLVVLEQKLHDLILREEGTDDRLAGLRLPDLSVLLELEIMEMWFPVTALSEYGYLFRIDGCEILVKSHWPLKKDRLYRITENSITEIQEAVLVHR